MSGAEAAGLVLGLISASISVIDTAKKLFDAAHDAKGLPAAFREVAARIPLVLEILRNAEGQLKIGKVKESTCNAVQLVMEQCKLKSEKLSALFQEVLPEEGASRLERYRKAVRTLGKGSRVEELMMGILADIHLLAENRSMGAATEEQFEQLSVDLRILDHKAFAFYQPNIIVERIENLYISSDRMDKSDRVYKMVPAHNENFVVRDILNQELMKTLPLDRSGSIAIWGLGGCGKTQIALNYAHQRHEAINCSVFWIRADSEDLFAGSYGDIAKEANVPETLTGDDKLRAVQRWIENQRSWLVVVDNADDLDDSRSQYLKHVPRQQARCKGITGAILWTTRDSGILDHPYGISRGIDASVMQSSDSLLLYRKLLHRTRPLSLNEYAQPASLDERALLNELGDLPLAISQAAAYIRKNGNIRKYVNRLRDSESEAWKLLDRDQKDPYRHSRQNSIMKTWMVSLTRLKEEKDIGANALQILYTTAFLDSQGITFELLQYSVGMDVDQDDLQDAVARLVEYSFLQQQEDSREDFRTYSQHKLFSMAMRHHLSTKGIRSTYAAHTFSIVLHCFPDEEHETADQCNLYLPHALRVLNETDCTHFQELADQLLPRVALSYIFHGRYHEARMAIKQLIALQDKLSNSSDIQRLEAQSALGWVQILEGEFGEAEKILTSTLDSQKMIVEQNHPSIWMTTTNLARAVQKNGQYDKAEALQLAVLEHHRRQSGPTAHDTLGAANNLALTYRYQGRLVEAEKLFKEILAEWEETDPKRPVLALSAQNNLALVFRDQGALDEAEKLLKSTIEENKARLGDSHPDTITSMDSLFSVYTKQGRLGDAEDIGLKVKNLSRTVLGDKHPLFLSASHDLRMLQAGVRSHCLDRDSRAISNSGYLVSNIFYSGEVPQTSKTTTANDGAQFQICDVVDKFDSNVEQGDLNKRGWVLQERALSRRTIHFTDTQTYWECGEGVWCETFTQTENRKASFLSDSNFPHSVHAYKEGMTLQLYQNLYERYSTLGLSYHADRPKAIAGLEKRLMQALNSSGGYGIFQSKDEKKDYFHRSLLWQRSGTRLERITFSSNNRIPSWSWMAFHGGIKYMNVPFMDIKKARDIISPFEGSTPGIPYSEMGFESAAELQAPVHSLVADRSAWIILDEPDRELARPHKCIIIGQSIKKTSDGQRTHFALILSLVGVEKGVEIYERAGVAYLVTDDLVPEDDKKYVRIR